MCPKRKLDDDEEDDIRISTRQLGDISILFIPFEAAKKFYRANAEKGVFGLNVLSDGNKQTLSDIHKSGFTASPGQNAYMSPLEIANSLNAIVRQECELIRNLYKPDSSYDERVRAWSESNPNFAAISTDTPMDDEQTKRRKVKAKRKVETIHRGYDTYPLCIFLSENPTGMPFPDVIDARNSDFGYRYVKKHELTKNAIPGLRPVNQMAFYLREDIDHQLITDENDDGLFLRTETLIRPTTEKSEYMIKVTLGQNFGQTLTFTGVHLRATLTNVTRTEHEFRSVQSFCRTHGIQMLVGDFNMDLQGTENGGRGVIMDSTFAQPPVFLTDFGKKEYEQEYVWQGRKIKFKNVPGTDVIFSQQYSSSNGKMHYMGWYQADKETLRLTGVGMYGNIGGSGSRFLNNGGNREYYSDHPSIFLTVASTRLPETNQDKIQKTNFYKKLRVTTTEPVTDVVMSNLDQTD